MTATKNLCAQISLDLHQKISDAKEVAGLTTAQFITNLLLEYYEMKEDGGKTTMANNSRTMAFQIPEELFQRIKAHLERETARSTDFRMSRIEKPVKPPARSFSSIGYHTGPSFTVCRLHRFSNFFKTLCSRHMVFPV